MFRASPRLALICAVALGACATPSDDFSEPAADAPRTGSSAGRAPAAAPPPVTGEADARGVIVYPDYAAVTAREGDSVGAMASRAGIEASELAAYNGLPLSYVPAAGDELVLPPRPGGYRVATAAPASPSPSPSTAAAAAGAAGAGAASGGSGWSPAEISDLLDDPAAPAGASTQPRPTGQVAGADGVAREVIYHQVEDGETVYSIARTYGLPAETLIAWNALSGPNYAVQRGQLLTVPADGGPAPGASAALSAPALPGESTPAVPPPSAAAPLPADTVPAEPLQSPELGRFQTRPEVAAAQPAPAPAPAAPAVSAPADGKMLAPVPGQVVRPFSPEAGASRNDGIDFAASPGEPVRAAADGEVALVSTSLGEWGTIVLVRHPDNLMTVYGRLGSARVEKGQPVRAGEVLGEVAGDQRGRTVMHFEVRRGAFSEDPAGYL